MRFIALIQIAAILLLSGGATAGEALALPAATIKIDASKEIAKIDPRIYGHFIEFLGQCIEGGLWFEPEEANGRRLVMGGVRDDVFDAVKGLNIPLLRWPGGCFSDTYNWRDGVGPREERPERPNLHWGGQVKNHFGTDEFLQLCEKLGAQPLINVNLGTGTAQEAADWVRYANDPPDTEFGKMRAANGHREPYGVQLWGIGNESYGDWEKGGLTNPAKYIEKYLEFYDAMKAADPSIQFLAVGAMSLFSNWNENVLKGLSDAMDYYSLHLYFPQMEAVGVRDPEKMYRIIVSSTADFEREMDRFESDLLKFAGPDTKIRYALDEWNLAWGKADSISYQDFELPTGLLTADMLLLLQRKSPRLAFANFALLLQVIPLIKVNADTLFLTPSYLAFQMVQGHSGARLLASDVDGPTYSNQSYGTILGRKKNPTLAASATMNEAGDRLFIVAINKDYNAALSTRIEIAGSKAAGAARVWTLNGDSPRAKNTFSDKNAVRIKEEKKVAVGDAGFDYEFPAHSVTAFEIPIKM